MFLDTNAVIYISKGRKDIIEYLDQNGFYPHISRVTYVEFLSDPRLNEEELEQAELFLKEQFVIEELDEIASNKAAELRREFFSKGKDEKELNKRIGDFLIIGTCISRGMKLLTFDHELLKKFPKYAVTL